MIDLRTCNAGDELLLANGKTVKYLGSRVYKTFKHVVGYPNGLEGTRTDDGLWDGQKREEPHELDIVGIKKRVKLSKDSIKFRIYPSGFIVDEDEFESWDIGQPYYDDYREIDIPIDLIDYLIEVCQ